jgi:hypothetical protein
MVGFLFKYINNCMAFLFNRASTGFLQPLNGTVDKLISASQGILCLAQSIFGAPPNIAGILGGLANVASAMITAVISAVTTVITNRVNQMVNSILSPIRQIQGIITDLTSILISTQNILDKALNMDNYFKSKQECANMGANLLNCIAQSAINKVTNKVAMTIDKQLAPLANNVSRDALKFNGSIHKYVDRHSKFIEKGQLQTKLLT